METKTLLLLLDEIVNFKTRKVQYLQEMELQFCGFEFKFVLSQCQHNVRQQ